MKKVFRVISLGFTLIITLTAIYYSSKWALADYYVFKARNLESSVSVSKRPLRWPGVYRFYASAVELSPSNSTYHRNLASFYFRSAVMGLSIADLTDNEIKNRSKFHFKRAIELRPRSPTASSAFLVLKSHLNEIDAEFYKAFQHAFRYGASDRVVLSRLGRIGLAEYQNLDSVHKEKVADVTLILLLSPDLNVRQKAMRWLDGVAKAKVVVTIRLAEQLVDDLWSGVNARDNIRLVDWAWNSINRDQQNLLVEKVREAFPAQPKRAQLRIIINQELRAELCGAPPFDVLCLPSAKSTKSR